MSTEIPTSSNGIAKESLYAIPAVTPEKERLTKQYAMKKAMYGWTLPVPSVLVPSLSHITTVLDIAAGTCIWTLDLAASPPQIRDRDEQVKTYACDIDAGFFPPPSVTDALGIQTFHQDMTKPFPSEYEGKFDFNIWKLLKPGGRVMLDEIDPVLFREGEYIRPADGDGYDLAECMGGDSWINKLNSLYTGFVLKHNFVVGLTLRLGSMLEQAGFAVEHVQTGQAPIGSLCQTHKGADGRPLSEYTDFSIDSLEFVITQFVAIARREGTLEVPPRYPIANEEEIEAIMGEVHEGLRTEGAICVGACFVARKVNSDD
ncbi:hypothetical protein B0H13DRAFT_2648589 [Mycena leptocephala]|nr:hypothetical protein B0H13DRAFT_2671628 [Mycena leptocephala]KAJ7938513.1 hypothetical protein B0H13DRAFT_2648589 [Mycena leptocephala]